MFSMRMILRSLVSVFLSLAMLVTVAACGAPKDAPSARTPSTACPQAVQELVSSERQSDIEVDMVVDLSGSFVGTPKALDRVRVQLAAVVEKAVDNGSAFHLSSFTGSLATTYDVAVCPTLAARYNNKSARAARTAYLKKVAVEQFWAALVASRPAGGKSGTSIVGGWRALAEHQPLAAERHAVMLSDGRGKFDSTVAVDLGGFATVGMYAIGSVAANPADTADTARLADRWKTWLKHHGARRVTATTRAYR